MGADLHADIPRQQVMYYLNDSDNYTFCRANGIDVTWMRDERNVPDTIQERLYDDLTPKEARKFASKLRSLAEHNELTHNQCRHLEEVADWLVYWSVEDIRIKGIH